MKRTLTICALMPTMTFAQGDYGNLSIGKYGLQLSVRYNADFEIGVTFNNRITNTLGVWGTDLNLSVFTEPGSLFQDMSITLEGSSVFGKAKGFGSGLALHAVYVRDANEAGNTNSLGLGTRLTPGYFSSTFHLTSQFTIDVPLLDKRPEDTEPLQPQLGFGFTTGFSSQLSNRWSITGAGVYLLNRWEDRDVETDDDQGDENGDSFPVDIRANFSFHH